MRSIIKTICGFAAVTLLNLTAFSIMSAASEIEIQEAVGLARLYSGEEKQAKDEALRNAMKKAIEQGVGAINGKQGTRPHQHHHILQWILRRRQSFGH